MATISKNRPHYGIRQRREMMWAYLFIAPTVIGLLLFLIGPIFFSGYISLTKWDNLSPPEFIGIDNYIRMFQDPEILLELKNTLIYTVFSVPLTVIFGLIIASFLNQKIPGVGFFRAAIFVPYVTLPTAAALVWLSMFNVRFGMINGIIKLFGGKSVPWMTEPSLIMGIVIAMGVWVNVGYYTVILLVGIKNLSVSYYEAAKIDGANGVTTFMKITIPLLTPQIFFVTTMAMINAFRVFDPVYIFGKTEFARSSIRTMVYGIFDRGFTYHEMGYASAEAMILFVIILGVTILQFRMQDKWVHY